MGLFFVLWEAFLETCLSSHSVELEFLFLGLSSHCEQQMLKRDSLLLTNIIYRSKCVLSLVIEVISDVFALADSCVHCEADISTMQRSLVVGR